MIGNVYELRYPDGTKMVEKVHIENEKIFW